jgi:hypothetical protein
VAASFQNRVRFHVVKLFEREVVIYNWLFNWKVNGFVRAQMAENVIDLLALLKQTDKAIHHGGHGGHGENQQQKLQLFSVFSVQRSAPW